MEEEFGEVCSVPGKDPASLVPFSHLIELDEKKKEEYVESNIVPNEGLLSSKIPLYVRYVRSNLLARFL